MDYNYTKIKGRPNDVDANYFSDYLEDGTTPNPNVTLIPKNYLEDVTKEDLAAIQFWNNNYTKIKIRGGDKSYYQRSFVIRKSSKNPHHMYAPVKMAPLTEAEQSAKIIKDSIAHYNAMTPLTEEQRHAKLIAASAAKASSAASAAYVNAMAPVAASAVSSVNGVSRELWNAHSSWENQQPSETLSDWIQRLTKRIPPKGTIVDGTMYGVKSKKSKKSSYRAYKKRYSICKMDPSTLTLVQSRKRRSVCKGYKKSQRTFSLGNMDKTLRKKRSVCK
jgi:hypothetical protein